MNESEHSLRMAVAAANWQIARSFSASDYVSSCPSVRWGGQPSSQWLQSPSHNCTWKEQTEKLCLFCQLKLQRISSLTQQKTSSFSAKNQCLATSAWVAKVTKVCLQRSLFLCVELCVSKHKNLQQQLLAQLAKFLHPKLTSADWLGKVFQLFSTHYTHWIRT